MSTKHLVLSLLEIEPSSGYDIAFRSLASIGPIWSATHSQIYTTLHKLLDEGLIATHGDPAGGGRKRVTYELTQAGRDELDRWRGEPVGYLPSRHPFLFWAQHIDAIDPDLARARIDEHERRAREALESAMTKSIEIREGRNEILERRRGRVAETDLVRARMSRAAVYDELAREAQFAIDTCTRLRDVVNRIEQVEHSGADREPV